MLDSGCTDHHIAYGDSIGQRAGHSGADDQREVGQVVHEVLSGYRELDLTQPSLSDDHLAGPVLAHMNPAGLAQVAGLPVLVERLGEDVKLFCYRCNDRYRHC